MLEQTGKTRNLEHQNIKDRSAANFAMRLWRPVLDRKHSMNWFDDPYFHIIQLQELDSIVIWSPLLVAAIAVMLVRFGEQLRRRTRGAAIELLDAVLSELGTKTLANGNDARRARKPITGRKRKRVRQAALLKGLRP
jgi:hypothetical protein